MNYEDVSRVKDNIRKMINKGANRPKIDQYLAFEGVTKDDLHTHSIYQAEYAKTDARMPIHEKVLASIGRGFMDVGQGVKQMAYEGGEATGLLPEGTTDDYTKGVQQERRAYNRIPFSKTNTAKVGRVVGNTAPFLLPVSAPSAVGRVALNAGVGGTMGATQFVDEGQSRTKNTVLGLIGGGGTTAALEGAAKAGGKVINAYKGNYNSFQADELMNLSKTHDIPLSAGDITQGAVLPKAETATEYLPLVGMGSFRQSQNAQAEQAAKNLLDNYAPSDDWAKITQTSLKSQAEAVKRHAKSQYDQVSLLADDLGTVPTHRMTDKAKSIIQKELQKKPEYQDVRLIHELSRYTESPEMNFSGMREIRSDLGDLIDDYYKGVNAVVGKKGAHSLQKIKNSLEEDMKEFATSNGDKLFRTWKQADEYYKNTVIPFKDTSIAKAVKTDTPDEIYRMFIQRGKRDRAQKFYNALDGQGQNAIRYKMIDEAYIAASKGKHFSPAIFSRRLEDINEATGVFFNASQKKELDGLTKLLRHAERGGQYMENPPTGQRLVQLAAAGATTINPAIGAKIGLSSWMIKQLTTTEVGKRLLLSASDIQIGSEAMENLIKQVEALLARTTAASTYTQTQ